jgi:DNA polymerase-3 subunit delta
MEQRGTDLIKEWTAGRFRPVYYFMGEDACAQAEAALQLKAALKCDNFNYAEFTGDISSQTAAMLSECSTLPVFADRRLVLVRGKLTSEAKAGLVEYLKHPSPSTTLVLFSDDRKPDPRDALVKAASAAGAVCVFAALKEGEAISRLQAEARTAGKRLSPEAAQALVAEAGTDWGILRSELDKVLLFVGKSSDVTPEHVASCLGWRKDADPFALARLIQARALKASLLQLGRLFSEGKPNDQAFKALAQIQSSIQKQLRAKRMQGEGSSPDEIFTALRLNRWWDKDYLDALKPLDEKRLAKDLKACPEAEISLKSKSWLSAPQEIEQLVVSLCARRTGQAA